MKRRVISILLASSLTFGLFGCNVNVNTVTDENAQQSEEEIQETEDDSQEAEEISDTEAEEISDTEAEEISYGETEETDEYDGLTGEELVDALNQVGPYPTVADLTEIYPDIKAAEEDCKKIVDISEELQKKYKGTMNNKESILSFFTDIVEDEFIAKRHRLQLYQTLLYQKNLNSQEALKFTNQFYQAYTDTDNNIAFAEAEIYELPLEERVEIFSGEEFDNIRHSVDQYIDADKVFFDENTQIIINTLENSYDSASDTYSILKNTEATNPIIEMPDGSKEELTDALYVKLLAGDYSHDFYKMIDEAYVGRSKGLINTYTSLLQTQMQENVDKANIDGKDTFLEYKLHDDDIEVEIYDNNIQSVRNILPDYHKYIDLHRRALGIDDGITYTEVRKNLLTGDSTTIEYDDAISTAEKALLVLGDEYVKNYDSIFREGHVDAYTTKGKAAGAFEMSAGESDLLPYILLNYNDSVDDMSAIAHEGGHAMYEYMAATKPNANILVTTPSIFTHEIASTLNEHILFNYLIKNAENDEKKLEYLDALLSRINQTIVIQTLYSEFEEYCYNKVESGEGLVAEDVCDYWLQLYKDYYGESADICDANRYRWATVPHFYYGYYVFSYSTSCTYSGIIAKRIFDGDEEMVDKYLGMLSLGGSKKPSELLATVDIDPTTEDVYSEFADYYHDLIEEYESLLISTGRVQ